MRRKNFVVAKVVFSIFVVFINVIFRNEKRKIKFFVHHRENDALTKIEFFSQRSLNKRRRFSSSTMFERERFTRNNFIDESNFNRVETAAKKSFFLFQNEKKKMKKFHFEQHDDDFDEFVFDDDSNEIEILSFVVSFIEKTKIIKKIFLLCMKIEFQIHDKSQS